MQKSASKHSPTPWETANAYKTARNHAIVSGSHVIARVMGLGYPIGEGWSPDSQADADFIVRAVNAHDGLVRLLQSALADIECAAEQGYGPTTDPDAIRAALAKAEAT